MLKRANPPGAPTPASRYVQTVEVPAEFRTLHVSGQVGIDGDGRTVEGFAAQAEQALSNVLACLAHHGMTARDIVKLNVFLTRADDVPTWRAARDRLLPDEPVASTLLVVAALASPAWLVEVEAIAAAPVLGAPGEAVRHATERRDR
jgi:enamine deaminase RidA (YjgF/YER057c/UK114 family)